MYYLYILYSASSDLYYVGYTSTPDRRLEEHNTTPFNTFTARHRPWVIMAAFDCGSQEGSAVKAERFVKKQKSRKFIERLIATDLKPNGNLAQLVRVPHRRD